MKKIVFVFVALLSIAIAKSQTVGIGTTTPNNSALLEVKSTIKGFLPPRMLASERNAIVSPATGLIIYCMDCGTNGGEPEYYNGTAWVNMIGGSAALPLAPGHSYQGGKIAYIFQSGDSGYIAGQVHGLIAAPFDQIEVILWDNMGIGQLTNAIDTAIGTGNANTNTIVSVVGGGNYAALLCSELELNGYTDWYLPSREELRKLGLNSFVIGLFGGMYWSSSEFKDNQNWAWAQHITGSSGTPVLEPKTSGNRVRAVRTF